MRGKKKQPVGQKRGNYKRTNVSFTEAKKKERKRKSKKQKVKEKRGDRKFRRYDVLQNNKVGKARDR